MIEPAKLIAFAGVTVLTSLVPGPAMVFIMTQSAWRGARRGAVALAGLQTGYVLWFILAGLGLSRLAAGAPWALRLLTLGGAAYLAWLGLSVWRRAGQVNATAAAPVRSRHAFRDGIVVALSNPKSMLYVVALLPQFLDPNASIPPQIVVLAVIAIGIDVVIAFAYIGAGNRLAAAMTRPALRTRIERSIGAVFLLLALAAAWAAWAGAL